MLNVHTNNETFAGFQGISRRKLAKRIGEYYAELDHDCDVWVAPVITGLWLERGKEADLSNYISEMQDLVHESYWEVIQEFSTLRAA